MDANIIELVDIKGTTDIYHDYTQALKADKTPLVIDNGGCKCRVGWSSCEQPLLEFRNLIAKPRKDRKKDVSTEVLANPPVQIGNDIVNIEAVRLQLKTQFDRNVVTHFHNQEQIFDYIFSHLSIDNEGSVPHPIMLTETVANPNYSRQHMSELLFECYGVPAVCYGIDALFSWQHNQGVAEQATKASAMDALIVSFGYHTTHVMPVLDGQLQASRARRLNVGGYHIITYLYRLMQMKYPVHLNAITISRIEALLHQHCFVAVDYMQSLRHWAQDDYYAEHVKKIQLPYTVSVPTSTLSAEQRMERRKELSRRLIESNARRAKEKQQEDEELLKNLLDVRELHENGETLAFKAALEDYGYNNLSALDKEISTVRIRLERMRQKLIADASGIVDKDKEKEKDKEKAVPKPPQHMTLEDWLNEIKEKHSDLLKKRQARRKRRQDIAKRHTAAAQERMRIISLLARNEKGTDEFGRDDNDWEVYKAINRDRDSDSESEHEKLMECEQILRHYDAANYQDAAPVTTLGAEHYQLHVAVEIIRAPELLFQPSMIGSLEAGLAELIQYVLKFFTADEQLRLAQNVFMTGGCAQFPGLKERLSRELLEMRPFQTPHNIYVAQLPELDAWLGARDFAASNLFEQAATTRADYDEHGAEYFREHKASNLYFPTPKQQE